MTNKKTTKRALIASVISLMLCFTMLLGTTYAWFTDSVTSTNNIITSGNLDVELYWSTDAKDWKAVDANTNVFTNQLWEPGHTEVVYLKVVNEGSLALKYQLGVNVANEVGSTNVNGKEFKLSDFIKFGIVDGSAEYTRETAIAAVDAKATALNVAYASDVTKLLTKEEKVVTMVVYMPTTVGNDANHAKDAAVPTINLGLNLYATQVEAENDSFGNDYDADAWVEGMIVKTEADLNAALANGENVVFVNDIVLTETVTIEKGTTAAINLNKNTLSGAIVVEEGATLAVTNGTLENSDNTVSAIQTNGGDVVLDNVTVSSARHGIRAEGGNVTINGGTYKVTPDSAKTLHALNVSDGATVTINGGTFIGPKGTVADSGAAVNVQADSTVTINGGNFSGGKANTLAAKGTLIVNGGTFDQDPSKYVDEYHTVTNENGVWTVSMTSGNITEMITDVVADAVTAGETEITVDANGATVNMGKSPLITKAQSTAGTTLTIKNAVIDGSSKNNTADGTVIFENCTFTNKGAYSVHFNGGTGDLVFKECDLYGWCVFGAPLNSVTMENCNLNGNGTYAMFRFYENATLKNCVIDGTNANHDDAWTDGISSYNPDISGTDKTITVTLIDCETINIGYERLKEKATLVGNIIVDGKVVVTDAESLSKALSEGKSVLIGADITDATVKMPATLNNVTIAGTDTAVLKNTTIMAADGNSLNYEGLTFDGVNFENSRITITGWRTGGAVLKDFTVTNCVFKNLDDTTNSAPVHMNFDASEAINGFTFTNNVIDGATGGQKSGVYAQVTGKTVFTGNVINNVSFRPYVIQVTTDDGINDEFIVTGNTFSGSAAGRAQGLGNNDEGTDTVKLVVSGNIFKDITSAQQICYWNFNSATTTADLSRNYYDIDVEANCNRFYYNSAAQNVDDLVEMGIYPYYAELNEDGTINTESLVEAQ